MPNIDIVRGLFAISQRLGQSFSIDEPPAGEVPHIHSRSFAKLNQNPCNRTHEPICGARQIREVVRCCVLQRRRESVIKVLRLRGYAPAQAIIDAVGQQLSPWVTREYS